LPIVIDNLSIAPQAVDGPMNVTRQSNAY